jgi:hypothetical protein
MWRNAETVFVQPLVGRGKQYGSVAAALESLLPTPHFRLTDITATADLVARISSMDAVVPSLLGFI